ncbi:hypothetical protein [Nocardioides sp.]|uniref:hypothetical protein n=1 Tax=Nocardioides sp. TaxID=35761 RepID=UPI003783D8DD
MTTFAERYPRGVDATIRETTPGYRDACRAVERLAGLQPPDVGFTAQHAELELANRLVERAMIGAVSPEETLDLAREVQTDLAAFTVAANGIRHAQSRAKQQRDSLISDTTFIEGYAEALNLLLTEVQDLEPLHELSDAASALSSKRADDYEHFGALASAYQQMRRRHFKMLRDSTNHIQFSEAAVFADPVNEFFEDWPAWRSHGYLVDRRTGLNSRPIRPPWPSNSDRDSRQEFEQVAGSAEFLAWAVSTGVRLWMPTAAEFEKAQARLRAARALEQRPNDGRSEWMDPHVRSANLRPRSRAAAEGLE